MYREVAWLQQNHCVFQGRLARSIIRQLSCRAVSVVVDSRAAAAVVGIFVAQAVVFYWCDPCNSFLSLFMHLRNQKRDLEKSSSVKLKDVLKCDWRWECNQAQLESSVRRLLIHRQQQQHHRHHRQNVELAQLGGHSGSQRGLEGA